MGYYEAFYIVKVFLIMVPLLLIGEGKNESFLSDIEYGKMLYNNPRGIPCSKCRMAKRGEVDIR